VFVYCISIGVLYIVLICFILLQEINERYKGGVTLNTLKIFNSSISGNVDNIKATVNSILYNLKNVCAGIEEDCIFELKVILNELLINAIKHGNKEECGKQVKVTAGLSENGYAVLIIEDEGEGYNYISENNFYNFNDLNQIKETGRGILIIKNLCDRVKTNNKGNKIVVLKKINKGINKE
jgi:serine/threonine-protein kinase RsbW